MFIIYIYRIIRLSLCFASEKEVYMENKKEKLVKIVINNKEKMSGCPQGKLNNDYGTPGPKCK